MGSQWVEKITKFTQSWTENDAIEFLDYLVDLIGVDLTLARIRAASYFNYMHYNDFREKVDFYRQEEYLGEDGIRKKLSQSFSGFHRGHLADIKNTIQKVQNIIGKEGIKRIFSKPKVNLAAFAVANTEIVHIVNWLEGMEGRRGIPRTEINEGIIRDPEAFTRGHLINLTSIATEIRSRLNKYGLSDGITLTEVEIEAKINEMIIRSPQALTMGRVERLRVIVGEIKNRLNKYGLQGEMTLAEVEIETEIEVKINEVIIKDPGAFTKGKVENLNDILEEVRERLKKYGLSKGKILDTAIEKKINEVILSNLGAFTKGKVENLRAIAEEIKLQLTGHEPSEELNVTINKQINEAILGNPGDFTRGKVENLRAIVDEIKDRVEKHGLPEGITLSETQINEAIIRNLKAFTSGNVANLRAIVKEIKDRVKEHGLPEGIILSEAQLEAKLNIAIIKYSQAFTVGTVGNLRVIVREVKDRVRKYGLPEGITLLTEAEIEKKFNEAIIRNPRTFTSGKIENLRAIAEEIKSQVKEHGLPGGKISEEMMDKKVNEAIIRNPDPFTKGKVENLKAIVKEIKDRVRKYGLPKGMVLSEIEINEMITKNTVAFTKGSVDYLRTIVKEIKIRLKISGFTETEIEMKINEAIIRNTEEFTKLTSKGLKAVEKRFGIDGLIEALKNLSTEQLAEIVDTSVTDVSENIATQDQEDTDDSDICPSSLQ